MGLSNKQHRMKGFGLFGLAEEQEITRPRGAKVARYREGVIPQQSLGVGKFLKDLAPEVVG